MNKTIIGTQGAEATALGETLTAADLNWEPLSDEVGGMDSGIKMPRKKLLFRSDTKQALGIVGSDYEPTDPKAFLTAQYEFAEAIQGKVTRAGFLAERSRCFAFIKIGEPLDIPRGKRQVGDPVQAYIYTTDGWDGGTPHRARLFVERLKCANGMTSREIKARFWISHTSGMKDRMEPRRTKFIGEVNKMTTVILNEFKTLAKARMSREEAEAFITKLIPGGATLSVNRRKKVLDLFNTGEGNQGSTRWDAYNAVTEFVTHHRTYRSTDSSTRDTNRFLGVLETDTLSRQAMNLLLN